MCSCLPTQATQGDVRFRGARRDDLAAVVELLNDAGLPTEGVETSFDDSFRIAESSGGIVGVAGVEVFPPHGLLRSVAVHRDWRGRGLGARLVVERIEWARAQGLVSLSLLTSSAADYFRRFGFNPADRAASPPELQASAEMKICPESATFMEQRLDADQESLVDAIRERYAEAARNAAAGRSASCCSPGQTDRGNVITSDLYLRSQTEEVPQEALNASLGCGNPTLLASLRPGEVVLDLGSGGGIDVLLSARRVGPGGKAYGLDMTDEMLALARANQERAGITNAEFLKGRIEEIPLPDGSVDVIVSNCVLNLSTDKPRAFREAFRALKPGGRLAVSDIVVRGDVPAALRRSVELWVGCVAGALEETEYSRLLAEAGFEEIEIEPTRIYTAEDARPVLESLGLPASIGNQLDGRFMSAFVRATHPRT